MPSSDVSKPSRSKSSGKPGAPVGNQNRTKHGFYQKSEVSSQIPDIDVLIADLQARMGKVADYMDEADSSEEMLKAFNLYAQATSRMGRLLRDKQALGGNGSALDALDSALDELKDELGIEL